MHLNESQYMYFNHLYVICLHSHMSPWSDAPSLTRDRRSAELTNSTENTTCIASLPGYQKKRKKKVLKSISSSTVGSVAV